MSTIAAPSPATFSVGALVRNYGPIAFGLVVLVITYQYVMRPMRDDERKAADLTARSIQQLEHATRNITQAAAMLESTARAQQATSASMEQTVKALERMSAKGQSR